MTFRVALKEDLLAAVSGRVRFNEPMRLHTSFHIGGPAEIWAEPQDPDQLRRLLAVAADAGFPVTMVGGGANLLVRDEGIPGLVVHLTGPGFQQMMVPGTGTVPGTDVSGTDVSGTDVLVGAALPLEWLIRKAQEASLSGVEFLAGVPGHVGGAVRMNAGTHDDEGKFHHFGDRVRSLTVMDLAGRVKTLPGEQAGFGYRCATFLSGWIVLEALLKFSPDDPKEIAARVQRLWSFKKRTQDWSAPSVGCIFKNPAERSAGWLIDQVGMKGFRIGGAVVSARHANFILNDGNARAADVLALVEEARARVLKQFGVELETEVQILPVHPSTSSGRAGVGHGELVEP